MTAKYFFATANDLRAVLSEIEQQMELLYSPMGVLNSRNEVFDSMCQHYQLGKSDTGDHTRDRCYIVVKRSTGIRSEIIVDNDGSACYRVGQAQNPDSITLSPGGIYNNQLLVCGSFGTGTESWASYNLYRAFALYFKQVFANTRSFRFYLRKRSAEVRGYLIGPESRRLMDDGVRMITMDINEDISYDLSK